MFSIQNDIYFIFDQKDLNFIDMKNFIMNCKKWKYQLTSSQITIIFDNILKCIKELHFLEDDHRDIKPENILINVNL